MKSVNQAYLSNLRNQHPKNVFSVTQLMEFQTQSGEPDFDIDIIMEQFGLITNQQLMEQARQKLRKKQLKPKVAHQIIDKMHRLNEMWLQYHQPYLIFKQSDLDNDQWKPISNEEMVTYIFNFQNQQSKDERPL